MEKRPELELAFAESVRVRRDVSRDTHVYTLTQLTIGELVVTSGRLIVCEVFRESSGDVFEFSVEPGNYPVTLSVLTDNYRNRVEFAHVQFAPRKPVQWELAVRLSNWNWKQCGIGATAGCVMDATAFPHLM